MEYLDISFNDITGLQFDSEISTCFTRLKYLDVRHNLLSYNMGLDPTLADGGSSNFVVLILLGNLETLLYGHQWYTDSDRLGYLWGNDENTSLSELKDFSSADSHNVINPYLEFF